MENVVNPEVNEPTPAQEFEAPAEEPVNQEPEAPAAEEPVAEEPAAEPEQEPVAEENEPAAEPEAEEPAEEPEAEQGLIPEEPLADDPALHFEAQITELQNQLTEMTTNYENAQTRIAELEAQITSASETEATLRSQIATYEAERTRLEVEQRENLVERYANVLTEEEISPIREEMNNFSLEELESKLAICFANKQMAGSAETKVVPLPEPVDEFALFMQKYRKN
jgi:chromosome segregation ATPase